MPEHDKNYKGKHRDPNAGRRARGAPADPQIYANLKGATKAKDEEKKK